MPGASSTGSLNRSLLKECDIDVPTEKQNKTKRNKRKKESGVNLTLREDSFSGIFKILEHFHEKGEILSGAREQN